MKRRITVLICLLVCCATVLPVSLSSCHGAIKNPPFEVPESFDESREYEITFWSKNDTNVTQFKIYRQAAEDFMKIYPNIKVTIRSFTDYVKIYNDVITNIPTNTTPNLSITYPDHIATYLTGDNVVVPLDNLINDPKYGFGGSEVKFDSPSADEITKKFLDECVINGRLYGVPFMRSSEALYVNLTMLRKLGYELPEKVTWDFVWEASDKAMAKDADGNYLLNGQKVLIPFIYKSTDNMMIQMLRQKDAPYCDSTGKIGIFNDVTKEIMLTVADHGAKRSFSTFRISSYPGNYLNAGQCLFAIDSTAGATWIGSRAPMQEIDQKTIVDYELAVTEIPQFDVDNPKMISQGPSLCLFNKDDPQEVLASWLFCQYLLTNGVQIAYSQTEGYVPVTDAARSDPEYLDYLSRADEDDDLHYKGKIEAAQIVLRNTENTFVTPVYNGSTSLREAAGELIEAALGDSKRGVVMDDGYFERVFANVTSLKRLNLDGVEGTGRTDLGPLPGTAKALLFSLAGIWVILIGVFVFRSIDKKRGK
ncbi:MAG: extracellular solute-binding protein [Clostridia bacterium]|nr:extracellular solute-binding protein [Clostridia bacterium]